MFKNTSRTAAAIEYLLVDREGRIHAFFAMFGHSDEIFHPVMIIHHPKRALKITRSGNA
jgi:hypothetical protein